jgi:hypothetical protein
VEGLDALSVEASARLQLGCRGEVADHRPRADPLRIADPELPADRCAPAPRVARLCASWIANADARRGSTELITGKLRQPRAVGLPRRMGHDRHRRRLR